MPPAALMAVLLLIGAGWGLTTPLAKIVTGAGHAHFGMITWQVAVTALVLGALTRARGKHLPWGRGALALYLVIGLTGAVIPNSASYAATARLPAGVVTILISTVPMFAFPMALALGIDRFRALRLLGLACGLAGVIVIVGPEAGLPDPGMAAVIPLALVAPFFYAVEGNVVARWGTRGLDPVQVLTGASVVGLALALPLALATGQWISPLGQWDGAKAALLGLSVIHAVVYAGYVWLVGQAGSVFAAQGAYLVTAFGVIWSITLLGERYSPFVWAAMALMLAGIFLVQPRRRNGLAPDGVIGNSPREPG